MSIQRVQMPRRHRADEVFTSGLLTDELSQELKHDARQSVATILALVAAGRGEIADHDRVLTRLDQVASQATALGALLDDSGEAPTRSRAVDVCAEVGATLGRLSVGYGGTVRLVAGAGARAELPRTSLQRILTNLVKNAMRAAGQNGLVQVSVMIRGGEVILDIEDDGPGFGSLPVINGIGLRSARRLARRADGRLETGVGRLGGALVRVSLPAVMHDGGRAA